VKSATTNGHNFLIFMDDELIGLGVEVRAQCYCLATALFSSLIEDNAACNAATTWAPSPTAAVTRFTEPERTSPIAKMPRRLVSSG
jgi:hypothetical protein